MSEEKFPGSELIEQGTKELAKHTLKGTYEPTNAGIYRKAGSPEDIKEDFKTLGITEDEYFKADAIIEGQWTGNGMDPEANPEAFKDAVYIEAVQEKLNSMAHESKE
jgi:hypothetical protein